MTRNEKRSWWRMMAVGLALGCAGAQAEQTTVYKGVGTYNSNHELLPLATGGAVVTMETLTTATVEPSEFGFMFGECAGLGYADRDNEFSYEVYCSFHELAGNNLDIRARLDGKEGPVEILGGTGIWEGATGAGTLRSRYEDGNRGSYEYEFTITTP